MGLNEEKVIKQTIELLDSSVDYSNYDQSDGVNTYLDYINRSHSDERSLMDSLFLSFLEEILGFTLGKTLRAKEDISNKGNYPDYFPVDTRTHTFLFDAKGTDTRDLGEHYSQIKKYIESHPGNIDYGVLSNMRDLEVYTLSSSNPVPDYSFSFSELYRDTQGNDIGIVKQRDNTSKFLNFVRKFSHQDLSLEQKFQKVKEGSPWTGEEELGVQLLVNTLDSIVSILHEDVRKNLPTLKNIVESKPERAQKISQEIEYIASQTSEDHELKEVSTDTLVTALNKTSEDDLYYQALDTLLLRTAYFTMTKLLLVRMWEDIGFIDQTLYDGGLENWYEQFNQELKRVLRYAFDLAGEKYQWLFEAENNYTWYTPSDKALIEVLYKLSNFNLGKLDRDVLGTVYEDYIDEVDKKNKGQYYTPREIVTFIWDQVGFKDTEAYFNQREGKREPAKIFDPASGSGGFLVEAARRIRKKSNLNLSDKENIKDIRTSIVSGLFGSEISVFPYYITEVNLLIQLTPVIKRLLELQPNYSEHLPLPVVQTDSLSLHNPWNHFFDDQEEPQPDENKSIMRFVHGKKSIWKKIKGELAGSFDYCCANPPYVGEKGHKEKFRSTRENYEYWDKYYQGKMDYFYWFIILGLSKLKPGGKLGFITTSYWPFADGASKLRKYILNNAKIDKMIMFGKVKIFKNAKGQHNMVFVLEKLPGDENKEARSENHPKIVRVKRENKELPGEDISSKLEFTTEKIEKHIGKNSYEDEYIKVFTSEVKQGKLPKNGDPWRALFNPLDINESNVERLSEVCHIDTGIDTGANKVTSRKASLLPQNTDASVGDGIFVLNTTEKEKFLRNATDKEAKRVNAIFGSNNTYRYTVQLDEGERSLIYITDDDDITDFPNIKNHLKKFKPILESRAEMKRNSNREWYSLAWPRKKIDFSEPKIVTASRSPQNCFALDKQGLYGLSGIFFIQSKSEVNEELEYILGVLNSEVIDRYCGMTFKKLGENREYIGNSLSSIPIRRIDFEKTEEKEAHDLIVEKVNKIRETKEELEEYSRYFSKDTLQDIEQNNSFSQIEDREKLISNMEADKVYSIRTHSDISIRNSNEKSLDSGLYISEIGNIKSVMESYQLEIIMKDNESVFLKGPKNLLVLLKQLASEQNYEKWVSLKENLLIPKTANKVEKLENNILAQVSDLRSEILDLQQDIDEAIEQLYEI